MRLHYPVFVITRADLPYLVIPDLKTVLPYRDRSQTLADILFAELSARDERSEPFIPPSKFDDFHATHRDTNTLLFCVSVRFEPKNRYRGCSKILMPLFVTSTVLNVTATAILSLGALETTAVLPVENEKLRFAINATQTALAITMEPWFVKFSAGTANLPIMAGQIDSWVFKCFKRLKKSQREETPETSALKAKIFHHNRSNTAFALTVTIDILALLLLINRKWVDGVEDYKGTQALIDKISVNSALPEILNISAGWISILLNQFNEILLSASLLNLVFDIIKKTISPSELLNLRDNESNMTLLTFTKNTFVYPVFLKQHARTNEVLIPDLNFKGYYDENITLSKVIEKELQAREIAKIPFVSPSNIEKYQDTPREDDTLLVAIPVKFFPKNRYQCFSKVVPPLFYTVCGIQLVANTILRICALETTPLIQFDNTNVRFAANTAAASLAALVETLFIKFDESIEHLPHFSAAIDTWFYKLFRKKAARTESDSMFAEKCATASSQNYSRLKYLLTSLNLVFILLILNRKWVDGVEDYQMTQSLIEQSSEESFLSDQLLQAAVWAFIIPKQISEFIATGSIISLIMKTVNDFVRPTKKLSLLHEDNLELEEITVDNGLSDSLLSPSRSSSSLFASRVSSIEPSRKSRCVLM